MTAAVQAPRPPTPPPNQPAPVAVPNVAASNYEYLRRVPPKRLPMPLSSGAGYANTFIQGNTLLYDVPTVQGGYLESILLKCNLTVNPATGTSATYAANTDNIPWGIIQYIQLQFGKQQVKVRPRTLKYLPLLFGYERMLPMQVPSTMIANAQLNAILWGSPFAITINTANPWVFWLRIFLGGLLPRSAAGYLPMMAQSTSTQLQLVLPPSAYGPDPLDNIIATGGSGTGQAVTVGGTISAYAEYRDGTNWISPTPYALDLTGQPTVQYYIDRPINPLTAGTVFRQKVDNKLQHLYALLYVVDGLQSTSCATLNNIAQIELDQDSGGTNRFEAFGVNANNIAVADFFERFRRTFGQDLDAGVVPIIPGPAFLGLNPDNQEGAAYLNMMSNGWTDFNWGIQVTSASSATIVPRIECQLISVNPAGLVQG